MIKVRRTLVDIDSVSRLLKILKIKKKFTFQNNETVLQKDIHAEAHNQGNLVQGGLSPLCFGLFGIRPTRNERDEALVTSLLQGALCNQTDNHMYNIKFL